MRRLVVLCICGERIQVPRSALGKTGLCPACGRVINITAESATPLRGQPHVSQTAGRGPKPFQQSWGGGNGAPPPSDAKRRFAEAVDLYFSQQYAQALSLFQSLSLEFPDNPDVSTGRTMCMNALKNGPRATLEDRRSGERQLPAPDASHGDRKGTTRSGLPLPALDEPITATMAEDAMKRVLMEKMLNGSSDEVQLRAAELAMKVFGIGNGPSGQGDGAVQSAVSPEDIEEEPETPQDETGSVSEDSMSSLGDVET